MFMDAHRYYELLGVHPNCSDDELRQAFRRRAKELHPDSESGNVDDFLALKLAYDTLSDPVERAHYDRISRPKPRRLRASVPVMRPAGARRLRAGGMSMARFVVAFLFMAGLSLAALETLLAANGSGSLASIFTAAPRHSIPPAPPPPRAPDDPFPSKKIEFSPDGRGATSLEGPDTSLDRRTHSADITPDTSLPAVK